MVSFRSRVTRAVLEYYFLNPSAAHYINELAVLLALDPVNLHRKLRELEDEGILKVEARGNQHYYCLNRSNPLLKEYKALFEAKYGLPDLIRRALAKLTGLESAILFGSYAGGKFAHQSDIDLLLIGSHSSLAARRLLQPMQKRLGHEINSIDMTRVEFNRRRKQQDPFLKNVLAGPSINII